VDEAVGAARMAGVCNSWLTTPCCTLLLQPDKTGKISSDRLRATIKVSHLPSSVLLTQNAYACKS
jgi:hypothetical protein